MKKIKYLNDEIDSDEEDNVNVNVNYLSNQNNDLFDDEAYIPHKLIRVRRVKLPQDGVNWEILENNQVVFVVNGVKLTKKEKNFLCTPQGFQLLIDEYKLGNKSIISIKKSIKKYETIN